MGRERITEKMLHGKIDLLNAETGSPETSYTRRADGSMHANIGNYHLDMAYGGVAICRMMSEGGGVETIIPRGTKRETFERLCAYLDGIEAGRNGMSVGRTFGY